ncbi:MAG: 2Fe-2S iron-sulfur cluster-binding protein [Gemmatimonadales bacterium]
MTERKMISVTIEGRAVQVPEGTSMLEAAKVAGVLIPHYCYHPGLPVAGVCRMCLVEVEKSPKLAPACATSVAEGQVIHVHSDPAREARQGVLEMLLINHPLDCPICDQSGECELQDYTFAEGRKDSRYLEAKRFNPVEDFGGDVLYVPNRCILCTRCVRFMEDVAHDPVLNVSERGDRAVIGKFEGQDLTHPWAGNVVDLCPVGALLSKDFLNKARSWDLDRAASICPNCTQGCNTALESRDNVVVRMRPRPNDDVNKYFLCDEGRLNYRWLNRRDRVEFPHVRQGDALAPSDWEVAVEAAAAALRGRRVHVVASPSLSNEVLFQLSQVIGRLGGTGVFRVRQGPEAPLDGVPGLSLRADRAANVRGAELLGFRRTETPLAGLAGGDALLVADEELAGADAASLATAASVAGAVVVIGTTLPSWASGAAVMLPIANMAEEEGTFTNVEGRVQRYLQAKAAPGLARPGFAAVGDLLTALGDPTVNFRPGDVFRALAAAHAPFGGMTYESLGLRGATVPAPAQAAAMAATT